MGFNGVLYDLPNAVYPSLEQAPRKQELKMKKIPLSVDYNTSFASKDKEKDSRVMWTATFLLDINYQIFF